MNGSVPLCCTSMGLNPFGFFCRCFLVLKTVKRASFFKLEEIHNDGPDVVRRALFVLGGLGYASDSIPPTKLQQIPLQNVFKKRKTIPLRQNWASLTFDHDHKAANRILDNPAPMSSQWFSSVPTARYRSLRLSRPAALLLLMCLVATPYSWVRYFFFLWISTHSYLQINLQRYWNVVSKKGIEYTLSECV